MEGEDLSSTDIHLACNDTLLVGQVAEITEVDANGNSPQNHQRKLQVGLHMLLFMQFYDILLCIFVRCQFCVPKSKQTIL